MKFYSNENKNKFMEEFNKYIKDNKRNIKIYDYYSFIDINYEYYESGANIFDIRDIKTICNLYDKFNIEK